MHVVVISIVPCGARSKRFSSLNGFNKQTDSLSFLDLSNNNIQRIEGLSSKARIMLSLNHRPLNFASGVLTEAHRVTFQKGTFPDPLYVLFPKTLHAPQRSRKCQGNFFPATPGPFFQKCLYTFLCYCYQSRILREVNRIHIRRKFLILTWWELIPEQHS